MPTLGSLFDRIGGFPLAAVRNGIEPVWASEIEAFPIEVTRKRFPSMLHVGDITKLNGAELPPVDIITGGSPCQDLSVAPVQCLDLTPGAGNLLGQSFWEINSAWLGESWMLNSGVSPSVARESSLSQILQDDPPRKYYLSKTACLGILRRAEARGKELPPQLRDALILQAGLAPSDSTDTTET